MRRMWIAPLAALAVTACSNPTQPLVQDPSNPVGSIIGRVTSAANGQPISGVTVSTPQAGSSGAVMITAVTDSTGAYALRNLAAGSTYRIHFSANDYVGRFSDASIPDTVGNYPQGNGTVQVDTQLAHGDATVEGLVIMRDALPAPNAKVVVDLRNQGYDVVREVQADVNGRYSVTGLPGTPSGLSTPVVVQPYDATADGVAEYNALTVLTSAYPAATTLLDLDLRNSAVYLQLFYSDIDDHVHSPTPPLSFTFNRQLDLGLTSVTLRDTTVGYNVAVDLSTDSTGTVLYVVPFGGTPLVDLHDYSVTISAVGENGTTYYTTKTFTAYLTAPVLAPVTALTVSPNKVDYNTTSLTLSWPASAGASSYRVYARDSKNNPSYLLLASPTATSTPTTTIALPSFFDTSSADAVQTPFAAGTTVTVLVAPVDRNGVVQDLSDETPFVVKDNTSPTVTSTAGPGIDNLAGGTPKAVTITVTFSEPMKTTITPVITLPFTSTSAPVWTWAANGMSGTLDVTVPSTTDGTVGTMNVQNGQDTSGNALTNYTGQIKNQVQLIANPGFESGALSPWTAVSTSTYNPTPTVSSTAAATGTYSAFLGISSYTYSYGYSYVYQDVTLPTGYSTITLSASYKYYSDYPYQYHDSFSCGVYSTSNSLLATAFSDYTVSSSFKSASSDITAYAGQTVRIRCQVYLDGNHLSYAYVDDIKVTAQ